MDDTKILTRKEQAQLTRQKIFEATVNLFKRKTFNSITISEICEEAEVSVGNFYNYFDNKKAILDEAFENFSNSFYIKYKKDAKDDIDPISKIYFVCDYYSQMASSRGKSFMTIFMNHELEKQETYINNPHRSTYLFLQNSVYEACEQGFLYAENPDDIFVSIFRMLRGTVYESILREDNLNLEEEVRKEIDKIINYYAISI